MSIDSKKSPPVQGSATLPRTFGGILIVACLAVVALAGFSLVHSRQQYRRRAEVTAQNLCTALADAVADSFGNSDLALLGMKDEIERQLASGGKQPRQIAEATARWRQRVPALFALRTVDENGVIEEDQEVSKETRIQVSDRDYFIRLKSAPEAGLVFSKPLEGRVQRKWSIMLARRINHPAGTFAGVVYGAMALEQLEQMFASVATGRDALITLRDGNLSVVAIHGVSHEKVITNQVSPAFRPLFEQGLTKGTYAASTPLDGKPRIHAFTRLPATGHYLHVGLAESEVFAAWRRGCLGTAAFVGAFLVLVGISSGVARIAWRRLRRAEADREQVIADLQKALAEVKALQGMLPICCNCKKIRDDSGYWNQLETYIAAHSEAQFTHGICPDCAQQLFPEVFEARKAERAESLRAPCSPSQPVRESPPG